MTPRLLAVLLAGLIALLPSCAGVPDSSAPQAIGTVELPSPKQLPEPNPAMNPGRTEIMFRALQNVVPSQLADRNLFDFHGLKIDETATPRFVEVMNL